MTWLALVCVAAAGNEFELEAARLTKALARSAEQDSGAIIEQLAEIGPEARIAAPLLEQLAIASHGDAGLYGLIHMGGEGVPALRRLLRHPDSRVRREVLKQVNYFFQPECEALLEDVRRIVQSDDECVEDGIAALVSFAPLPPDVVRLLVEDLKRSKPRLNPLDNLTSLGERARLAIPTLRRLALSDASVHDRSRAAGLLAEIDQSGKVAVPVLERFLSLTTPPPGYVYHARQCALSDLLRHPNRRVASPERMSAMLLDWERVSGRDGLWFLCGETGAIDSIPYFRSEFRTPHGVTAAERTQVKVAAAAALVRLEPGNKAAVQFLVNTVSDDRLPANGVGGGKIPFQRPVRADAALALGYAAPQHTSVLPTLRRIARVHVVRPEGETLEPSHLVLQAAWSVARLDPRDEHCVELLCDDQVALSQTWPASPVYRETPQDVARVLGDRIDLLLPRLLDDGSRYAFKGDGDAQFARRILAAANPGKIPALVDHCFRLLARDQSDLFDEEPLSTLLQLDTELSTSLDTIIRQCTSPHVRCRATAVHLLGLLRIKPARAVPTLSRACQDKRVLVRSRAATSLGKFGPAAVSATPVLQRLLGDRYESVRVAAARSLRQIKDE